MGDITGQAMFTHMALHQGAVIAADLLGQYPSAAADLGPRGGEVLGALLVAMVGEVPLASLRNAVFPFPTFYGGIGEMIGAYGRGLEQVIEPGFEPPLDP